MGILPPTVTRDLHHVDYAREPSGFFASACAESTFRDAASFAADLARLERHYRDEAERLRREASEALAAAKECRQWATNVRQQPPM